MTTKKKHAAKPQANAQAVPLDESVLQDEHAVRIRALLDRSRTELVPAAELAGAAEELSEKITEGCEFVMAVAKSAEPHPAAQRAMHTMCVMATVTGELLRAAAQSLDGQMHTIHTEDPHVQNARLFARLATGSPVPFSKWASLVRREVGQLKIDAACGIASVGSPRMPETLTAREHFDRAARIAMGCFGILFLGNAKAAGSLPPSMALEESALGLFSALPAERGQA